MIKINIVEENEEKVLAEQNVDLAEDIKTAPFLTGLAPSSVIQKIDKKGHPTKFKQNF